MAPERNVEYIETVNAQLDFIKVSVGQIYANMDNELFMDEQISRVDINDVHRYIGHLGQVEFGQDLIYGKVDVSSFAIEDEQSYEDLCYYSEISKPKKFDPEENHRVHFVKIRKKDREFVMTVIPIELEDGSINIRIEKLNREEAEMIRDMYKRTGKMRMEDIPFVKL